jgi:hypothetical protein
MARSARAPMNRTLLSRRERVASDANERRSTTMKFHIDDIGTAILGVVLAAANFSFLVMLLS